ncbi:DUF2007 domain-containing protein [Desulfitobacterium sp. THU1]|uniref:putative signal transducing protein n=1 Tax=Desulfitobacterium sp. THU1 TaxID=3138072 RepID=UPI00311DE770
MKKWLFLTNVTTEIEADIVIALLEQAEIPAQKAFPGSGNLKATYGLINGVEIYVPEDWMEQAKEILEADKQSTVGGCPEE